MQRVILPLVSLLGLLAAPALAADTNPPDYRKPESWLCRPGAQDPCSGDAMATIVAASGEVKLDTLPAAPKPKIDCFYVYPTVSTDAAPNSDMTPDAAERFVAQMQAAPFRQVCRVFAPLYRQVTLAALRDRLMGKGETADRAMAYGDVKAAFADYMAHDNKGRGVILIGHSQGSGMLKALIQNEIEGKPAARQLIAAYVPGNNLLVPQGKDVGGDLKSTPLCASASQTGCVVSWVSFRETMPVPPLSLFGRPPAGSPPGMAVACVNPAALVRGVPAGKVPLDALMSNGGGFGTNSGATPKWVKGRNIYTPFAAVPGLLSGECQARDDANVLSVTVNADQADPRTDTINGDVLVDGQVLPMWGLHLVDVNLVLGDLVRLARLQGDAWLRQHRK